MAAAAATARPAVLRDTGAVLAAMTSGLDATVPNMARVYDYWLGGKDHFPADRAEADLLLSLYPPLRDLVRENRAFVTRAVAWAAEQGISQFLDLGAGLPASPAVHQAARAVLPAARVAYVDTDPVVLAHARALLATSDGVTAVAADLRDPAAVLADKELRTVIDPDQPAGVILGAVLHFLDAVTARTVAAPGSRQGRRSGGKWPAPASRGCPGRTRRGRPGHDHCPGGPGRQTSRSPVPSGLCVVNPHPGRRAPAMRRAWWRGHGRPERAA
jgi:S-adenosyl methyltransferase